jgi:hypothetical protein
MEPRQDQFAEHDHGSGVIAFPRFRDADIDEVGPPVSRFSRHCARAIWGVADALDWLRGQVLRLLPADRLES